VIAANNVLVICYLVSFIIIIIKFLLHGVSMVKIVVFVKGVGQFECTFQGEWGVAHQRPLAIEN